MGAKLPPFAIADTDGTPTVWQPTQIYFPNGVVTDIGNGTVFVNTGPGGGTTLSAATPILIAANTVQVNTSGATSSTYWRGDFTWAVPPGSEVLEARTPLLKAGTILSVLTDSVSTNFLSGIGRYVPAIEARSPLLKIGSVVSVLTDGSTTNYLRGDGTYRSIYEARSPFLAAGTILSLLTDGTTTNFLRGDSVYAIPASNSGVKLILFTVFSNGSWTSDSVPIGQAPFETPITIRQVNTTVSGGASPELGFNIDHRIWGSLATSGTNLFSLVQSANSTGFQATTFNSANIPARAHLVFASSAVIAGNVDYVTGAIYYTRDSI